MDSDMVPRTCWATLRAPSEEPRNRIPSTIKEVGFVTAYETPPDKKNQLIADEIINHGTVDHAPVYPREVVRRALELSASAVILVHNHPSGDQTPSAADIEMTRKVVEGARTLGIAVDDHVVVGRADVASFKALGLM